MKRIIKNRNVKNLIKLVFNSGLGQILPLFSFPIITNYFNVLPESFAKLGLYISLVNILAMFSSFGIYILIATEKNIKDASSLAFSSIFISLFINLIALILSIFLLSLKIFPTELNNLIILVPICSFIINFNQFTYYFNIRIESISISAKSKFLRGFFYSILLIITTMLVNDSISLILSYTFGWIASSLYLLYCSKEIFKYYNFNFRTLKKNIKNILFFFPGQLLNRLSSEIIYVLFYSFYSAELVGIFFKAYSYIMTPISFLSSSISDIFRQMIVSNKNQFYFKFYLNKLFKISFIVLIFSILIYYLIDDVMLILFPNEVIEISKFSRSFIILAFVSLTLSPFSGSIIQSFRFFKIDFYWQIILYISVTTGVYISGKSNFNIYYTTNIYVIIFVLMYF